MKEYRFKKIDAFATAKSAGNPAGYIWLNSLQDMTEQEMLQIAKELQGFVNEVGYVAQVNENEFDLKYYSSEREVDLCGHATIAIMYDLIKTNVYFSDFNTLLINTKKGQLIVENKVKSENSVYLMSPNPVVHEKTPEISEIAKNLIIDISEISSEYPVSIINAGLSTLIVPIVNLNSIINIKPDLQDLKEFCFKSGVDVIEVFTPEVFDKSNDYRTRVFAPTFGYIEDPATGSGNSAFGYYLINNDLWKEETITIEQNGLTKGYNIVKLKKQIDENKNTRVCFGGGAITRIEGKYMTYD